MLEKIFLIFLLSTELWIFGMCSVILSNEKNIDLVKRGFDNKIPLDGDKAWMSSVYQSFSAGLAVTTKCTGNTPWTSATLRQENPSWAIDLQRLYNVQSVVVTVANNDIACKRFQDVFIFVTYKRPDLKRERDFSISNYHFEGPASVHETVHFTFTEKGRYVKIVVKGSDTYLGLCHVEIFGELVNLTKIPLDGSWAWMSSLYGSYSAGFAVTTQCTGNTPWTSGTLWQKNPSWAIDLQRLYNVQSVVVTVTKDGDAVKRFQDVFIFVTDNRPDLHRKRDFKISNDYFEGPASIHQTVHFIFTAKGRYVEIVVKGSDTTLELCHVDIFGELVNLTINGMWSQWKDGSDCSKTCGRGVMKRTRKCDNPKPENGGSDCKGKAEDTAECKFRECSNPMKYFFPNEQDCLLFNTMCGQSLSRCCPGLVCRGSYCVSVADEAEFGTDEFYSEDNILYSSQF